MSRKTESFDLNTAVSFLPIMDDTENVTKQLISSISMYNSLLDEKSKPILIDFIVNSRLSPSVKVRLSKNYKSVDHLVNDMNKFLIPKKSFTVIQEQLSRCTQNQRSIDAYGNEIEKLFVDLTIAQADGDQNKQRILRPINEKMAINRFVTGLRDENLRTIILARNYKSLKDAVQGAKDQQASKSLGSKQFSNNNAPCSRGRGQAPGRGGHHNQGRGAIHSTGHNTSSATGKNIGNNQHQSNNQPQRGHSQNYRGNSRGTHHNHDAPGKNIDNRDGNNHSEGHHQKSRGTHDSQVALSKNIDNRNKGLGQAHRGNSGGANQSGNYHNQGNQGQNSNHGGNNTNRPAMSVNVSEFQVDCQFRLTATAAGANVNTSNSKNAPAPNKNKQLMKKQ